MAIKYISEFETLLRKHFKVMGKKTKTSNKTITSRSILESIDGDLNGSFRFQIFVDGFKYILTENSVELLKSPVNSYVYYKIDFRNSDEKIIEDVKECIKRVHDEFMENYNSYVKNCADGILGYIEEETNTCLDSFSGFPKIKDEIRILLAKKIIGSQGGKLSNSEFQDIVNDVLTENVISS